jgi:hemoglobin
MPMLDTRSAFSETAIDRLVDSFYARVRADRLLEPVFADRITDWAVHLERMGLFWRSVLLGQSGYRPERGSPRMLHARLDRATQAHYDRWLELFEETAHEVFEPPAADLVAARARRMAVHLSSHPSPGGPSPTGG